MRGRNYAWLVVISGDEDMEGALLSLGSLNKAKTSGSILALITTKLSASNIPLLKSSFDFVVVVEPPFQPISARDFLLIQASNLTLFSRLIVIVPGVLIVRQTDELFDMGGFVMDDDNNWAAVVINPGEKRYAEAYKAMYQDGCILERDHILDLVTKGEMDNKLSSNQQIMEMFAFGKNTNGTSQIVLKTQEMGGEICETREWVAIVGMSCRFPQADSIEEYWDILKNGKNTCSTVPEHRLPFCPMDTDLKANFLKCRIDEFDAGFFGMSPSEAVFTDPQARLLLEVSWEAFEDAGINPDKLRDTSTGVFYGCWLQEYKEVMNMSSHPTQEFLRKYLGNGFGCTGAKLSFFYGFKGPNIATDSGCSSSMIAVDLACKSLQRGECPVALAAGANIILQLTLNQKVVWAEDGLCKTFDADANGYARSEGVCVLVLKRYSDAIRDNDRIHGVIRGSSTSQEGLSKSFGAPTIECEARVMKNALQIAKVHPSEVSLVEGHATGTVVGDPIEASAIVQAYSSDTGRCKPLYIGSGKTNIGHTESCAGIAGIIKVLLAMKHETIPAHINLKRLNPKVNFDGIPGVIPLQSVAWPRNMEEPRIAGISSFGITGTDVHMILQEPPLNNYNSEDLNTMYTENPTIHILTWSAKTEESLDQLTKSYYSFLQSSVELDIGNICYTANARRAHHNLRRAVVGSNKDEIIEQISTNDCMVGKRKGVRPLVCFTFPGITGRMNFKPAQILYATHPSFKQNIDHCDTVFTEVTGLPSFQHYFTETTTEADKTSTQWCASIVAIQYSLVKLWESWGVCPDYVMGHCLGEMGAAVISGGLSLQDAFKLCLVTNFSNNTEKYSMLAINTDINTVQQLITEFQEKDGINNCNWLDIACVNSPSQTTIVGNDAPVSRFKGYCALEGYQCKQFSVDIPVHSKAYQEKVMMVHGVAEVYSNLKSGKPSKVPHVSSVTGQLLNGDSNLSADYWYNCFRHKVQYSMACSSAISSGCEVFVEIGLGDALTRITQDNFLETENPPVCLSSFQSTNKRDKGWRGLFTTLAQLYTSGVNINWENLYQWQNHKQIVDLPHYPFQRKSFWFERKQDMCYVNGSNIIELNQNHPLLGGIMPNALAKPLSFYNSLMASKDYIGEHVVGTEVIFPGAGYLEMMLAAGKLNESNGGGKKGILVTDFTVHHPLHIDPSSPTKIQTVIQETSASIYALQSDKMASWKLYASGEVSTIEKNNVNLIPISITEIKERCQPCTPQHITTFYERIATAGLNFGPQFKSLKKVYHGQGETFAEVGIPEGFTEYVCHPILIDAMLQCWVLHWKPETQKLYVPVRVDKFISSSTTLLASDSSRVYIYCKAETTSGLPTVTIYLLDLKGHVLGVMFNPELVATTVDGVLAAAGVKTTRQKVSESLPSIYETQWKPVQNVCNGIPEISLELETIGEDPEFQGKKCIVI